MIIRLRKYARSFMYMCLVMIFPLIPLAQVKSPISPLPPTLFRPHPLPPAAPVQNPPPKTDSLIIRIIDTSGSSIDPRSFGAKGDGIADDYLPLLAACNACILYPRNCTRVRIPAGYNFRITQSLLLQNNGQFFTITLGGDCSNKSASNQYLSKITFDAKTGYAIGIQLGRSIRIENITITGQYLFPSTVSNVNIGIYTFADWYNAAQSEGITDTRNSPYSGISIDPNINASGSSGGTSDVTVSHCSVKQFMVGIALTPNSSTLNDEMINILEDDIEFCRVAIAIGQDQSKTINIKGLKVWASVHTVLDGVSYGRGTGGGSVFCESWNIAGNTNELFNLNTDRFPLSCKDIYSESLFRIGTVRGGAGANCLDCSIDFLTGPGMPAADYLLYGNMNFLGGCIRYYDNSPTHRLSLSGISGVFRDLTLNNPPLTYSFQGYPLATGWDYPKFDNVHLYYNSGVKTLKDTFEGITRFNRTVGAVINRTTWTGYLIPENDDYANIAVGDYILGAPGSSSKLFWDQGLNPNVCATIQIGRVTRMNVDTVFTDDVGVNCSSGTGYDNLYISKTK